jgi:hypothetical protein
MNLVRPSDHGPVVVENGAAKGSDISTGARGHGVDEDLAHSGATALTSSAAEQSAAFPFLRQAPQGKVRSLRQPNQPRFRSRSVNRDVPFGLRARASGQQEGPTSPHTVAAARATHL